MLRILRLVLVNFAVLVTALALLLVAAEAYLQVSKLMGPEGDPKRAALPPYKDAPWAAKHYPVAYFSRAPTDQRADLDAEDREKRKQFEILYPLLRAGLAEAGAIELTAVLDGEELYYVDFCHLAPNGNERVARAIAEIVEPELTERD